MKRLGFAFAAALSASVLGTACALPAAAAPAAPPTVRSMSVHLGATSGGTRIVVRGSGFSRVQYVEFGKIAVRAVHVVSSTELLVTVPRHTAGKVDVRVRAHAGTSKASAGDRYTYIAAPSVAHLSVSRGATAGGSRVVISGANFTNVTSVAFGGVKSASIRVTSSTSITAVSPPHQAGLVDVIVRAVGGSSSLSSVDRFLFTSPPAMAANSTTVFPAGTATTFHVSASGVPAPTFTETGALPPGVTLNPATGDIAGTASGNGEYLINVQADNGTTPAYEQVLIIVKPTAPIPPTQNPTGSYYSTNTLLGDACSTTAGCNSAITLDIDNALESEGYGPIVLPSNYATMSAPQQIIAGINAERQARNMPLYTETASLDADAQVGANAGDDPPLTGGAMGGIWAGGDISALAADFEWMYEDGPGSTNLDCTPTVTSGCWGHRDNIIGNFTTVGAGYATGGTWSPSYAAAMG